MATSTINWPSFLPQFIDREGYTRTPRSVLVRTEVSSGPPKVRRRSTARSQTLTVNMVMSKAQLDIFEQFFTQNLGYGALSFNFPEPENPTSTIVVRFDSSSDTLYSITPDGDTIDFSVALNLEIL